MNINFDKSRYIELLKKEETLKNQEISFLDENPKESCELLSYKIILENQIYYNRKTEYIFLVEEYLRENAGEDGARLFLWEFFIIFKKDNKALEILEQGIQRLATFCINPKSTEFSALINEIVGFCQFLTFDPEDKYGITLDQFRDSIEKIFMDSILAILLGVRIGCSPLGKTRLIKRNRFNRRLPMIARITSQGIQGIIALDLLEKIFSIILSFILTLNLPILKYLKLWH